ncbi:PhnA domain-containing protein [Streptomyces sp. NPDC007861]
MSDVAVKDSNGTVLQDGDSVTLTKDLKVKGLVLKTQFLKKA